MWVYLQKSKNEVFDNVKNFCHLLDNQFDKRVKFFRSHNGSEFVNNQMDLFCKDRGIIHQTSCVYTPQQNGIVERKHRHLLNVARALMFQGSIPLSMWSECILTATYLINRLPSSVLSGKSPYELVFGFEPSLSHLRVFGCLCFATILNNNDKFSSRSEKCVFIGYSNNKKGYKLFSLDRKIIVFSRDVKFYESVFPFRVKFKDFGLESIESDSDRFSFFDKFENSDDQNSLSPNDEGRGPTTSEGSDFHSSSGANSTAENENVAATLDADNSSPEGIFEEFVEPIQFDDLPDETECRKSVRSVKMPKKYDDFVIEGKVKYGIERVVNYSHLTSESLCFVSALNKSVEPSSYFEASKNPLWVDAMNAEMEALNRNGTWVLTNLPPGRKPIGCRWVYKIKYKSTGEIDRYKARLVAKGYNQREGVDFYETFSPVVKMVTVRCMISIAVNNNWDLYQLDVNNAFLYGDLTEDVYMSLPPGYFSKNDTRVCKLVKSLYGLKQAPRKWNEKLTGSLLEIGFIQSKSDYSLFIKSDGSNIVALLVYVDDIVITGNNIDEINRCK